MNVIKQLRRQLGYTQADLVKESSLSLRTIQRFEAEGNVPQGHSLKMLARAFKMTPAELKGKFSKEVDTDNSDVYAIKMINFSVLAFFIFPFGNLFCPIIMWRKNHRSKLVDEMGKRIINFQIFWTLGLMLSLSMSPFINIAFNSAKPLILYVLFLFLAINMGVVFATARSIQREEMNFPKSPVALF